MSNENQKRLPDLIRKIIEASTVDEAALRDLLNNYRPEDIADALVEFSEEDTNRIVALLPPEAAGHVILEADPVSQEDILEQLPPGQIADIVDELPPDEGVDLVQLIADKEIEKVLSEVKTEARGDVEELLTYPDDTAGGVMTPDLVKVPQTATAQDAITTIQGEIDAEMVDEIYVIDKENVLVGVVTIKDLITAPPAVPVLDFMRAPISVNVFADQEEAARQVTHYNLRHIPVVDSNGTLHGVVTADDVIDIMDEEASEDIHRLAGVHGEHPTQQPLVKQFAHRMPWLLVTVVGGFAAAFVVNAFGAVLNAVLAVAFFMPVVIGLSGSVGIQSSAMMVRGIATGEVVVGRMVRLAFLQLLVGFLIGLACAVILGLLVALIAPYLQGAPSPVLGLVIGAGVLAAASLAAFMGTVIPMVAHRIGADPAVVAGPFVTVLIDFTGLFIYLLIALVFLKVL
ncbi:MAG: magnesium transporter [Planctomycetota bacterium]|nr:MAG: magnesium transporter [Planctomycetota bacterium]